MTLSLHFPPTALIFAHVQGKSLSIICGAVKWLLDREERDAEHLKAVLEGKLPATSLQLQAPVQPAPPSSTSGDEVRKQPDWLTAYEEKKAEREALQSLKEELQRKEKREARLKRLREEIASAKWKQKMKVCSNYSGTSV